MSKNHIDLRLGLALAFACTLGLDLRAQPPEPVLAQLPREARWEVVIEPIGEANRTTAFLSKIESNRTARSRVDVMTWSDGGKFERWYLPYGENSTLMLEDRRQPTGSSIFLLELNSELPYDPSADWPELSWIKPETAVKEERMGGVLCILHEASPDQTAGYARRAWVRSDTKLPVAYEDGVFRRTYKVLGAPIAAALPARFERKLEEHRQLVAAEKARSVLIP